MSFLNTPDYCHAAARKTAVVLVNLGTPQAPTAPSVRTYLAEFLGDPRVVEIPRLLWLVILHGIILRVRPAKSAAKYATVWTPAGSPLAVHTAAQADIIAGRMKTIAPDLIVTHAMNYGQPSLKVALDDLVRTQGVDKLLVVPLFPQYSATTTGSIFDVVCNAMKKWRNPPELRMVKHYHDDPAYIAALAAQVRAHWAAHPWTANELRSNKKMLVMTFHGLPQRNLMLGDPYHCECHKTARLLAESLGLSKDEYTVTFQSRFGKAKWLQPYTEPTLIDMVKTHERVDIFCPGFTGDCLETLEEIAMEAKEAFIHAGGKTYHYIEALNEAPLWMDALQALVQRHLLGWDVSVESLETLQARAMSAKSLGAAL
jgi:protoporphyrin/coproporphyrin ferrochelatase